MAEAYIINDKLEDLKEMMAELEWPANIGDAKTFAHFLEKLDTMRLAVSALYVEASYTHYAEPGK